MSRPHCQLSVAALVLVAARGHLCGGRSRAGAQRGRPQAQTCFTTASQVLNQGLSLREPRCFLRYRGESSSTRVAVECDPRKRSAESSIPHLGVPLPPSPCLVPALSVSTHTENNSNPRTSPPHTCPSTGSLVSVCRSEPHTKPAATCWVDMCTRNARVQEPFTNCLSSASSICMMVALVFGFSSQILS